MHDKRGGGGPKNLHDVIDAWSLEKRESEGVVECGLRWGCVLVVRRFFMVEQIGPILEIREGIKSEGRFHALDAQFPTLSGNSLHAMKLRALCSPRPVSSQFYFIATRFLRYKRCSHLAATA